MTEGRNVLVTGGAGFVGANLVRHLLNTGYQVTVLDNLSNGRREHLEGLDIDLVEGDILDLRLVPGLVMQHDVVVHLAAQTGIPGSLEDPRRDCEVNVLGTLNLLEAARAAHESGRSLRFVLASSNAPLGRQEAPATEDKAPLPISPYGASKLAGEAYCLAYHGSWRVPTAVLRFGNLYGPFSGHKTSVVAQFCRRILAGESLAVDGDGQQTRDFIYVGDLCRAIRLGVESEVAGEIFQIAAGVETSITTLAMLLQEVAGMDVALEYGPARHGDIRKSYSQITKAERLLGWRPETSLRDGLRETLEWFRA